MVRITNLNECTFEQALKLWNRGFLGYFVDMTFTMDQFIYRFGQEGLSPELSVVAWVDEDPVGFVLNGIRTVQGKRIAWNGGTGVVPEHRRSGVGRRMMEACLEAYRKHAVDIAYLEAIAKNAPAIALYEGFGYRVQDHVTFFTHSGPLGEGAFHSDDTQGLTVIVGRPHEAARLAFYQAFTPWQTHWQSLSSGQSAILRDRTGSPVAYALYKHNVNEAGDVTSIALYQCEVDPVVTDKARFIRRLLRDVYVPSGLDCRRFTVNISMSNRGLVDVLEAEGFTVMSEQVFMSREMNV